MSVTSQVAKSGPFTITGSPQVIPVGFPFQQASDLLVLDYGTSAITHDPALVLVLNSDYTVTGGGYDAANQLLTGSITVLSTGTNSVATGDNIVILRNSPLNQTTSLLATGPLTIALIEQALDKMATLSQQVNELAQRSLHFENFETINGLLSRSARAGFLLGFDDDGNIAFTDETGSGGGTLYTAGAGLLLSANEFSVNPTQSLTSLTVTNPIIGSLSGNADTATALATARNINGAPFDGTANITVTAAAGTLTGTTLNSTVTAAPGLMSAAVGTFGTLAIQNATNVAITGGTITGMPSPTNASDVATKAYADNIATGIVQRTGVQVATTANLAALSGEQTIDGVLTSSSRILVKNQTLSQNNGIYVTAAGAWSRATDSNTAAELLVGYYYFVSLGTTQGATGWTIQTAPTVLGTDPVVFAQFSASTTYTAGTGLTLVGNVFAVNPALTLVGGSANNMPIGQITPNAVSSSSGALNGSIGLTTPFAGLFTTIGASGTITKTNSAATDTLFLASSTTTTGGNVFTLANTGGMAVIGLENSAGTYQGFTAYDFGISVPVGRGITQFVQGTGTITRATALGLSVTGNLTASGGLNSTPVGNVTPNSGAFTTLSGSVTATGSVTSRSLASRFANVINVKDFGAIGNGVTDDTAAIQAAIATAVSGSVIYFPQAQVRYNCTGFSVPASLTNVLIKGDQAQIYQPTNANNQLIIPNTCSYITVEGMWFNGVGSARANGIHIRTGADYTTIRNCRIEASSDWGIQVDSAGAAVKGFVCENNLFKDTLGDGVHVMNVDGFRISNNTFWQCGDDAIAALAQSTTIRPLNGVITDNYIYGRTTAIAGANTHGFRGICVMIGRNILIEGNNIYNTYAAGIEISDEYNSALFNEGITVRGNLLYGTNVNGGPLGNIQMYFCKKSVCSGNTIVDPINASGISFTTCSVLDISSNKISQSLNQFCRGVVNDSDASYQGRTITASNDIIISDNEAWLTQASNNEMLYLMFTTGARCNSLIVANNKSRSTALAYITTDWVIIGKFVNNVTIGGTTAPSTGANSTGITSTNNN